jgi:Cof subfamily protein (haloacid dehalogenase superfamily)
MNEKQIVFFDLDGTLLTSELKVADSSIEAIHAIRKQGVEPVIATGRTIAECSYILEATGINSCVAMNGQYVVYNGEVIYENPFEQNKIKELHVGASRNGHELAFYNADHVTVTVKDFDLISKNFQRLGTEYPPVDDSIYLNKPIHLMVLFCKEGEEAYYQRNFPYFQFVRNSPFGCDVYPAGTSKATGIERLISHLSLSLEATYAFGDGLNDVEMFQLVKYSVAMGNAVDIIKKMANFVTNVNDEDGISNGLRICGLLK